MKKRVLSLILIISIAISGIDVFSAAEITGGEEEYVRVHNILRAIGAFERYDGGKGYDENVTRAEFIAMFVSVILPDVSNYGTAVSPFSDVETNDAAYRYICAAYDLGIIAGNGSGTFRPKESVTYNEALKILISILGYDVVAQAKGGFPYGYHAVANSLDLNSGISKAAMENFKYGDCLVLLLNGLNAQIHEIVSISSDSNVTFQKGGTLLYNSFRVVRDRGILTENQYTTLTTPKGDADSRVTIGNFKGRLYGGVSAENYIGYEVEFYYQKDTAGDYVVYLEPTNTNKVRYITSEDRITVSDNNISYYPEGSSRISTVVLPASARVIYNGKAYPDYPMSIFEKEDADFRLIDNNGDGKIDVVNVTVWDSIFVYGVDTKEKRIIDKYDGKSMIDLKEIEDYIIWDSEFNQLELSEIKTGVVANSVKSIDEKYVRIIITDNKQTGVITTIKTVNQKTILALDKTEYVLSNSYARKGRSLPSVGASAVFYLDYNGQIAAIESGSTDFEYGYIIGASNERPAFSDCVRVKLLKNNGVVSVHETDTRLKIDGDAYEDSMLSVLNTPQVIRYKLTADEKIRAIDTITQGTKENENSLRALTPKGTMKYYPVFKIFAGSYHEGGLDVDTPISYCMLVPDANTKLIVVPKLGTSGVSDEDYTVTSLDYFTANATKVFQGYNANVDSYTPDVVYMQNEGGGNLGRGRNSTLITEILTGLNGDENAVTQLKLLTKSGEEKTLALTTELNATNPQLGVGDFINYTTDMKNDISDINIIYSNELKGFHPSNQYGVEYYGSEFNPYCGTVYDRQDKLLVLKNAEHPDQNQFVSVGNAAIYIVEQIRGSYHVRPGTVNDIQDTKHFGAAEASRIFYYTYQTAPQMIVIYR